MDLNETASIKATIKDILNNTDDVEESLYIYISGLLLEHDERWLFVKTEQIGGYKTYPIYNEKDDMLISGLEEYIRDIDRTIKHLEKKQELTHAKICQIKRKH